MNGMVQCLTGLADRREGRGIKLADEAEHVGLVSVSPGVLPGLLYRSKRGCQSMSWYDVEARQSRVASIMNVLIDVSDGRSRTTEGERRSHDDRIRSQAVGNMETACKSASPGRRFAQ